MAMSTASTLLNHLVATLRAMEVFAEVSLAAPDATRTPTPRADVTFDGLERVAMDDAPGPAWRLAAVFVSRARDGSPSDANWLKAEHYRREFERLASSLQLTPDPAGGPSGGMVTMGNVTLRRV